MLPFARMLEYGNAIPDTNKGVRTQIVSDPSPSARYSFGYTSFNGIGYFYGGATAGAVYTNDFWKFDTSTEKFTQLQNGLLSMHGSALAGYGNKIYMFGGNSGSLQRRFFVYDIGTDTWTENTTSINVPTARHHCRMVSTSDAKLYLWGSNGGSELFMYDIGTDTWTKLASSSITNEVNGDMVTDGTYLYCQGSNGQKYSLSSGTWSPMASMIGRMVYNPYNSAIYCVNNERLYMYNKTHNTWTEVGLNTSIGISRGALYTSDNSPRVYSTYGYRTSPTDVIYRFI